MAIYIFHGLTYSCLRRGTPLLDHIDTLAGSFILIAFCILLTGVFSLPQFTSITNRIASLRLPQHPLPNRQFYCPSTGRKIVCLSGNLLSIQDKGLLFHCFSGMYDLFHPFFADFPEISADIEYRPVINLKGPFPAFPDAGLFFWKHSFIFS